MKKLRLVALSALLVSSSAFAADQARSIMDKADAEMMVRAWCPPCK